MDSLNTNRLNLPSYENRLASEARVARINELYNRAQKLHVREENQRNHRDSIISDNSTSVAGSSHEANPQDNYKRLTFLPKYQNQQGSHRGATLQQEQSETVTIKPEVVSNPFNPKITEVRPRSKDEMEQELHFTPELRSTKSLVSSRSPSSERLWPNEGRTLRVQAIPRRVFKEPRSTHFRTNVDRGRRRESFKELKQRLGRPVPLGYLSSGEQGLSSGPNRKELESRWKKIISGKNPEISQEWDSSWNESRSPSAHTSLKSNSSGVELSLRQLDDDDDDKPDLDELEMSIDRPKTGNSHLYAIDETLRTNSQKLDQVLALLDGKQRTDYRTEAMAWIICIIILIGLNLYLSDV
ncbi:LADA_0E06282g1_1 [Lachancea dasiensis]|uniref:LADA_0E06282g1_1 n=1 Tax=Lachancea dasiensis TaxID=1072105 RepID=A0A1G4JCD9_9SACH|nr:LADA_0E06282g1_1 [Lachancea dasiensis]